MRRLNRLKLIPLILFLIVFLLYFFYEDLTVPIQYKNNALVRVTKVYDGDTIGVLLNRKEEKVRLIGIDAPEIGQRPWGKRAKEYMTGILNKSDWKVRLEFDIELRDKYNRILAYVWTKDGKMINLLMLENGFAVLFTVPPNLKYVDNLRIAQKEARQKELGIWSEKGLKERPFDYRKEQESKNLIY